MSFMLFSGKSGLSPSFGTCRSLPIQRISAAVAAPCGEPKAVEGQALACRRSEPMVRNPLGNQHQNHRKDHVLNPNLSGDELQKSSQGCGLANQVVFAALQLTSKLTQQA